jgi:hypothetical protein
MMRYYLCIALFFLLNFCFAEDYIIEFQAKVKNLKEFDFSNKKKFRNYDLEGTFTDNYGNIGIFNAVVISDVEAGKLIKLDSTGENIYANNEKIYFRGIREKSDIDAGIAYNLIIGATKKLNLLVGTKCTTSVRYFDDAIFGINKCKSPKELNKLFSDIN